MLQIIRVKFRLVLAKNINEIPTEISGAEGSEQSHAECERTGGDEDVADVILEHVQRVLEHLLPGRVHQPGLGHVLNPGHALVLF